MTRRWRRMWCVVLAALLVSPGGARSEAAPVCSCASTTEFGYEHDLARADVVFDGTATQRTDPATNLTTWRFVTSNVVKGSAGAVQDVSTPPIGACPATFEVGTAYRVFARRSGGFLLTDSCSNNRVLTGYRLAAADGGVFAFGASTFHGSAGGLPLAAPVVGMASTPSGRGYWLAAADGGVFAYGDARFFGSAAGQQLNAPVVGITASPTGGGYWLAAADGGVFAYGDARFFGSAATVPLAWPVVDIAATGSGAGYWLLGIDGGVFAYGDAGFFGAAQIQQHNSSGIVIEATGITASHSGTGYWISDEVALAGGFGDTAPMGPTTLVAYSDIIGVSRTSASPQLVIASSKGLVNIYEELNFGDLIGTPLNAPVVAVSS